MDDETAALFARLTLHEGLLEQMLANWLMADADPRAAVEAMRARAVDMVARTWTSERDRTADFEVLTSHLLGQTERFWLKVQERVEDECDRREAAARDPDGRSG